MSLSLPDKLKHFEGLQVGQKPILQECFIHVYDKDLEVLQLCNYTQATVVDSIVPFLTTHIVVEKLTPVLKSTITQLQSKAISGTQNDIFQKTTKESDAKNKLKAFNSFLNIKIVTSEWLRQSLL